MELNQDQSVLRNRLLKEQFQYSASQNIHFQLFQSPYLQGQE